METELIEYESQRGILEDLGSKSLKIGTSLGATQIEISLQTGFNRALEIKNNSITGVQQQTNSGVIVRAYINKQLGIATGTSISSNSLEEIVKSAVQIAKLVPEDENFSSLPSLQTNQPAQVTNLFDNELANLDPVTLVESSNDVIQAATEAHERATCSGRFTVMVNESVVTNSLGVNVYSQNTAFNNFSMVSIPVEKTNVGVGFEFYTTRVYDKSFDFSEIGKISGEKALKMLDAKVAPSGSFPVLFDERGTYQTLSAIIGMGVNGFSVMNNVSYFTDKIGENIAIDDLTIWDDPHVAGGMGSRIFDVEGVPTTNIGLVDKGLLTSYVTDSYTANKLGVDNTGSASRSPRSKVPRPQVSQLQINAGTDGKLQSLLEDMKEGIYIESGVGPAGGSPNISSQINRGFYVKNGEIQYPLKNSMLGSNVYEFLKGINAITSDLRVEFGHQSPAIMIKEVSIAGTSDKKRSGPTVTMGP